MSHYVKTETSGWVGWAVFAGVLLIMDGIFQFIIGLTTLFNHHWYAVTNGAWLVFNYTGWGWIQMAIGVLLALAGLSLLRGDMAGRIVAVVFAVLSAIANLAFLNVFPLWSLVVIAIDVCIMYAVIVHGGELAAEN